MKSGTTFWGYVGYGLGACVFIAIPLFAVDWLVRSVPGIDRLAGFIAEMETPGLGLLLGAGLGLVLLALLGWVLRRFLWDSLRRAPVIGTLVSSTESLGKSLEGLDRHSRELVAWVPFIRYRNLGIVMSRNTDPDGKEYATVYLLSSAGQFQGNSICNVRADRLVYPGWTIDEAIVFSSSGGAVTPHRS